MPSTRVSITPRWGSSVRKKQPKTPDKAIKRTVQTPPTQTSTSSSTPPSSYEQRQEDSCPIPDRYVTLIQNAFGKNVDIYTDIFQVRRNAGESELRVAYFRRGRQVLSQQSSPKPSASIAELSKNAKQRFQAVSMAYEIVTTPEFKRYYDENGLQSSSSFPHSSFREHAAAAAEEYSIASSSAPILRSGGDSESLGRSKSVGRGIRWSEEVEELVYKQDEEEVNFKTPSKQVPSSFTKGPRKVKQRVIVEAQELVKEMEEEMNKKAKNAPKSFMAGFLDDIEASLDGIEASVEEFVRFAMSEEGGVREKDDGETVETDDAALVAASSVAGDTIATEEEQYQVDQEPGSHTKYQRENLPTNLSRLKVTGNVAPFKRERVGELLRDSNLSRSSSSRGSRASGLSSPEQDDSALLFAEMTRPPPSNMADDDEVVDDPSIGLNGALDDHTSTEASAENDDDLAKKLFADLTKPPPHFMYTTVQQSLIAKKGTEKPNVTHRPNLPKSSTESRQPPAPPTQALPMSKPPKVPTPVKETISGSFKKLEESKTGDRPPSAFKFDPFEMSEAGTLDNINFEDTFKFVNAAVKANGGPPEWINQDEEGDDCEHTVSTMSESITTEMMRERFHMVRMQSKISSSKGSMVETSKSTHTTRPPSIPETDPAMKALLDISTIPRLEGQSNDEKEESMDLFSGIVSNDDAKDIVKLEQMRSGLSSLTGHDHVSTYTMQHEHGLRGLCSDVRRKAANACTAPVKEQGVSSSSICSCGSDGDEDFVTRVMTYMKDLASDLTRFGSAVTSVVETVSVQEDEMQSMLEVLSQSMEVESLAPAATTSSASSSPCLAAKERIEI